jgi:hypothetical protein
MYSDKSTFLVLIQIPMSTYLLQTKDVTPSVAVHCGIHVQMLSPYSSVALHTALYVGNPLEISLPAKVVKTS